MENELHISMKNKELIQMLGLEKSLVYFSTSLKGNELVLEKLMRTQFVKAYPEDEELLEAVSYTHLDVYKRQRCSAWAPCARRAISTRPQPRPAYGPPAAGALACAGKAAWQLR